MTTICRQQCSAKLGFREHQTGVPFPPVTRKEKYYKSAVEIVEKKLC